MNTRTPFFSDKNQTSDSRSGLTSRNGALSFALNRHNPLSLAQGNSVDKENDDISIPGVDTNKPLEISGLLTRRVNRTASHEAAARNSLRYGRQISRPSTTVPAGSQGSNSAIGRDKSTLPDANNIITPSPFRPSENIRANILNASVDSFKVPAFPAKRGRPNMSYEAPKDPENAHILDESSFSLHSRPRSNFPQVAQQPTPDSSSHSPLGNYMRAELSETHDQQEHLFNSTQLQLPQRIFPARSGEFVRTSEVMLAKKKRTSSDAFYDNDPATASKRQRKTSIPEDESRGQSVELERRSFERSLADNSSPFTSTPPKHIQGGSHAISMQKAFLRDSGSPSPHHQPRSPLSEILQCDSKSLIERESAHFNNRLMLWKMGSEEDWQAGADELKQRFDDMIRKTQDFMKRKQDLFTELEHRINTNKALLENRAQALIASKEKLVYESQNVLRRVSK